MPSLYANGKNFALHIPFPFRSNQPVIDARMSADSGTNYTTVIGVLNTSLKSSILCFETAHTLGIGEPKKNGIRQIIQTATGKKLTVYTHVLLVKMPGPQNEPCQMTLCPGFTDEIDGNYFGRDWGLTFCIAIDHHSVNLLKD